MIKNLRKKFTVVAMCSMLLVLAAIMSIFNLLNYFRFIDDADRKLQIIAENDGRFPVPFSDEDKFKNMDRGLDSGKRGDIPQEKLAKGREEQGKKRLPPQGEWERMSPEDSYRTRYFSVQMDETGKAVSFDLQHIAAVSKEEAEQYAQEIFHNRKQKGFRGNYRYKNIQKGKRTVIVFLDSSEELELFQSNLLTSLLVSGGGLLAVFILVLIFSGIVFRPVAQSYEKQKRFITDVSHELKTPLTIIDANAAVIEMERGEDEWTKSIRKQVRRLADFTQQLIMLTKLEEGGTGSQKKEISLTKAAAESVQSFEAVAINSGKTIEANIQEQIVMMGDEKSIRQLIGILIDNAVKYSPAESTIKVSLIKRGKRIYFEVYNETDMVPKGNLDMLFERFFRLDVSRNSETGGSGIGLSVAHAIAEAHHGKIRAKSDDGKSVRIIVEF